MSNLKNQIQSLLEKADVQINGSRPWDIKVYDERLYARVLRHGSLGLGEAYMDRWWDSEKLDEFFTRVLAACLDHKVAHSAGLVARAVLARVINPQTPSRSFKVGEHHYDIGNDLYQTMLDKRLTYTCGYWKNANDLDEAQEAKLDLICRKIGLKPGDRVLDIGCGWGSFLKFAAERYGAQGIGITVSKNQVALGQNLCQGLPIEIRLQDYREVSEKFDHVVSLGMFEHVGYKNYRAFMQVATRCLKDGGLFLLHTIGGNRSVRATDDWIGTYIFPNSMLPSVAQIATAIEGIFVMEDWHNFGAYYDETLMAWHKNFTTGWPALKEKYDERFYRMWTYYLLSCAGSFRARRNQLWQIVLGKIGVPGGYTGTR